MRDLATYPNHSGTLGNLDKGGGRSSYLQYRYVKNCIAKVLIKKEEYSFQNIKEGNTLLGNLSEDGSMTYKPSTEQNLEVI